MPVVQVPSTNSTQVQPLYKPNRRVYSLTVGLKPGLQDEIKHFPTSIIKAVKELLGRTTGSDAFIAGGLTGFNVTNIQTQEGYIISDEAVYFLESFATLTPDPASFYGFFELELTSSETDDATLDFWDDGTNTPFTALEKTKTTYQVEVYDNYETTATFPTVTPGRIRWLDYTRASAGGNILTVTRVNVPFLQVDSTGNVLLSGNPTEDLGAVPKQYVDNLTGVKGLLIGGTRPNGNNPPTIKTGVYEVKGTVQNIASDISPSFVNDNYGHNDVTPGQWYAEMLDSNGNARTHILNGSTSIIGSLAVSSISNTAGSTWRYNFSGTPNLSSVLVGHVFVISGCDNAANDGKFVVTAVNDGSDYIEVTNGAGVAQAGAGGTGEVFENVDGGTGVNNSQFSPTLVFVEADGAFYSEELTDFRIINISKYDGSGVLELTYDLASGREWADAAGIPIGVPMPVMIDHVPPWGIACDGAAVSRTVLYDRLFARWGTLYGIGDGSTTFNTVDLRGEFLRGFDNGRGADPNSGSRGALGSGSGGDNMGTSQSFGIEGHDHAVDMKTNVILDSTTGNITAWNGGSFSLTQNTQTTGGSETRPRNVYALWVVKY